MINKMLNDEASYSVDIYLTHYKSTSSHHPPPPPPLSLKTR